MKDESKGPRSAEELVLYKAAESRAGGQFDPKRSGTEMTNSRGMTMLENLARLSKLYLVSIRLRILIITGSRKKVKSGQLLQRPCLMYPVC